MPKLFQFGPSSVETIDASGKYTKVVKKHPHAEAIARNKVAQRESDIEKHLVKRVKALGGEVRKVAWIGRRGAPDRLVMLPPTRLHEFSVGDWDRIPVKNTTIWVELKAPGVKPESYQLREHERMRAMGQRVVVIDSVEGVEELLK